MVGRFGEAGLAREAGDRLHKCGNGEWSGLGRDGEGGGQWGGVGEEDIQL